MLDVYADWCVACKELEALSFGDAAVRQRIAGMTLLRVDVTANKRGRQGADAQVPPFSDRRRCCSSLPPATSSR